MMRFNFFILAICSLLVFSCKKDKSTSSSLPQPSHIGSNTLFYTINDKQHYISGVPSLYSDDAVWVTILTNSVLINSYDRKDANGPYDDLALYANTQTPELNKQYFLGKTDSAGERSHYTGGQSNDIYYADSTKSYVMFTRFDAAVIAGTFAFYGTKDSTGQTIELDNGWFDVNRKQ